MSNAEIMWMAQNNGKDPVTTKLRITGVKEPVVWIKDDKDNKPIAWMRSWH